MHGVHLALNAVRHSPVEVWHCPLCDHHWPLEEQECGNCHSIYAPDTHP
jgi:hypothetical protein